MGGKEGGHSSGGRGRGVSLSISPLKAPTPCIKRFNQLINWNTYFISKNGSVKKYLWFALFMWPNISINANTKNITLMVFNSFFNLSIELFTNNYLLMGSNDAEKVRKQFGQKCQQVDARWGVGTEGLARHVHFQCRRSLNGGM